jgi:hypothetical protein
MRLSLQLKSQISKKTIKEEEEEKVGKMAL